MSELVFLSATRGVPFSKTIKADSSVRSYPRVQKVSSQSVTYTSPSELHSALVKAAAAGQVLLKGTVDHPLVNESRKGSTDRDDPTQLLVLDIDELDLLGLNIPTFTAPIDAQQIAYRAEQIVQALPMAFRDTSYVIQASASLGRKLDKFSGHIFFMLDKALHPRALREYVTALNFHTSNLEDQISLSASATALSFRLDRTANDNGRLIYITPAVYENKAMDPVQDPAARIQLVKHRHSELDIESAVTKVDSVALTKQLDDKLKWLRQVNGLSKKKQRTKTAPTPDGGKTQVVVSPDRLRMTFAEDEGSYVRYNINGGDSNAYWVHKGQPQIVFNFKGEPNFLFHAADPDTYAWHCEKYTVSGLVTTPAGHNPLVFLDYASAKYYYGLYDSKRDRMDSLYPCDSTQKIKHFCSQHGVIAPEDVPVWEYEFKPYDPRVVSFEDRFVNMYEAPEHMRKLAPIPTESRGVGLGYATAHLSVLCPTIHDLLMSVCGDGVEEYEHFINWLAYVVQKKSKTMTAWLFQGVPGTGKGLLYHHVLAPLLGEKYAAMKRTQDIEEKFNLWLSHCLLFVVDEFKMSSGTRQEEMLNKVKNLITETRGTVRAMGTDQMDKPLFANVLFFSNDRDAVRVQAGDRRFNVAPRQEMPILKKHPYMFENNRVILDCATQLPVFASFLAQFKIDEMAVILPLENEAKRTMREATKDASEAFAEALVTGNLDYFIPILDEPFRAVGEDYVSPAKNIIKLILRDFDANMIKPHQIWTSELRPLFNVLCGQVYNDHTLGRILAKKGINTKDIRKAGQTRRGLSIHWKLELNDITELRMKYLTEHDQQVAIQKEVERNAAKAAQIH